MPHVASETKAHVLKASLPSARPPQAADRASATPFESLLDDGSQAAASRPSTSDDNAPRTERPDNAPPATRAQGSQAAKSGDSATSDTKPAAAGGTTGKPAGVAKAASGDKPATDATPATGAEDAKPAADGKPADGQSPADLAATAPANPVPTISAADAIATALALAPAAVPQAAAAADNVVTAATAKAKPDLLTALPAGTDKPADDAKLAASPATMTAARTAASPAENPADRTAPLSHTEARPQASDADQDAVAHARGEVEPRDNHAAGPHSPATITADAAAPKASADALPPTALTAPSQSTPAAAAATPLAAAPQLAPQAVAVPLAGVAIEIASKALAGKNQFEIRLDPPELGRIEVGLNVDRDGNVTSRVIADRADTLDLLRRDASGLERALQDAGLKTADNGLQFSLRDHSAGQEQAHGGANTARLVVEDETLTPIDASPRIYSRLAGQGSGIDIQV